MDDLVQTMGGTGVSKSEVSRLCKEIDERVQAFLNRPLEDDWPIVWLDAADVDTQSAPQAPKPNAITASSRWP